MGVTALPVTGEGGPDLGIGYQGGVRRKDDDGSGRVEAPDGDVARRLVKDLGAGQGKQSRQSRLVLLQMRLLL